LIQLKIKNSHQKNISKFILTLTVRWRKLSLTKPKFNTVCGSLGLKTAVTAGNTAKRVAGKNGRGVLACAARVTANKGAIPPQAGGMVFAVTLASIGVPGCKQKQNNR
jgi:hypothetical protein